jgi:hypothetical protein
MDIIAALRRLLDPLVERTSFVLTGHVPYVSGTRQQYGLLEYHAVLTSGRLVLLGFYQRPGLGTITAEMWSPGHGSGISRVLGGNAVDTRYQVWSYGPAAEVDELVRTIVAEVASWLQTLDSIGGPDAGGLSDAC